MNKIIILFAAGLGTKWTSCPCKYTRWRSPHLLLCAWTMKLTVVWHCMNQVNEHTVTDYTTVIYKLYLLCTILYTAVSFTHGSFITALISEHQFSFVSVCRHNWLVQRRAIVISKHQFSFISACFSDWFAQLDGISLHFTQEQSNADHNDCKE